uniref:G-protein coupled receptors family 1 profile domain-containing protein n=1 Tax=Gasterosteus aculeatus aculeatus TaxID=481459 RepID=G3NZX7_GASAC
MSLNDSVKVTAGGHMGNTLHTFPPDNASLPSSALSLCPTAVTLVFLPSAYTLLSLTALPGNALSLWVFLRCIATASPTHVYLSHLSVSNLMVALTAPFHAAFFARGSSWPLSGGACQLVVHAATALSYVNIHIGMAILTWLALSRFAALVQHTHASRRSACTTLLPRGFFARLTMASFASRVCGGVWVAAVVGTVAFYYLVQESVRGDAAASGGCVERCYSPAVEIGRGPAARVAVAVVALFFLFYLLVLLSYMSALKHIERSRRSARRKTSQSLLGRVLRNIVIIQVVLSVCLLPYYIFKAIFISWVIDERQRTYPAGACNLCHPLSPFIELKNCLLLLAASRGSTDPLMYFLLDETFRHQGLRLLRCKRNSPDGRPADSARGSDNQRGGQLEDGIVDFTV